MVMTMVIKAARASRSFKIELATEKPDGSDDPEKLANFPDRIFVA